MFIFDFVAETVLDQIIDWLYGKIVGFLNDFFAMMNNMGVELFDLPWVNAITTFFGWLGWALFVVGLVVGAFECAIEYQGGRGSIKDTASDCRQNAFGQHSRSVFLVLGSKSVYLINNKHFWVPLFPFLAIIFASFFRFMQANVSPTFISIRAFPIICV